MEITYIQICIHTYVNTYICKTGVQQEKTYIHVCIYIYTHIDHKHIMDTKNTHSRSTAGPIHIYIYMYVYK